MLGSACSPCCGCATKSASSITGVEIDIQSRNLSVLYDGTITHTPTGVTYSIQGFGSFYGSTLSGTYSLVKSQLNPFSWNHVFTQQAPQCGFSEPRVAVFGLNQVSTPFGGNVVFEVRAANAWRFQISEIGSATSPSQCLPESSLYNNGSFLDTSKPAPVRGILIRYFSSLAIPAARTTCSQLTNLEQVGVQTLQTNVIGAWFDIPSRYTVTWQINTIQESTPGYFAISGGVVYPVIKIPEVRVYY